MAGPSEATVRLVRNGYEPVDILPSQVKPASVGRTFSVSERGGHP